MDTYFIFLLFNNSVAAFIIYKIYTAFYEQCRVEKWLEIGVFTAIQVILLLVYLVHPPSYIMAASNLVLYIGYTFLYSKNIKKNLIVVSGIFAVQLALEVIVYVLFMYTGIGVETTVSYESVTFVVSNTMMNMMRFIFMMGLRRYMKTYKEYDLPTMQWLCLLIPPTASIVLIVVVPIVGGIPESLFLGLAMFCIGITLPTFILFDSMSSVMVERMNQRMALENQKYYENQVQLMQSQLMAMKTLKHDLRNKLTPLYLYAEAGDNESIRQRLTDIIGLCEEPTKYANTGSTDIDSVVNFKLSAAKKFTEHITTDIVMPADVTLPDFDLVVVLGNLLDNAIEGLQTTEKERQLDVKMSYSKGRMMISIENSFDGEVQTRGDKYITRKENSQEHGLGLKSVQSILDKYDGVLKLTYTKDRFIAKALFYVA